MVLSSLPQKPIITSGTLVLSRDSSCWSAAAARFAVGLTLKPIVDDSGWARSELGLAVALFLVVSAVHDVRRPVASPTAPARSWFWAAACRQRRRHRA